MATTVFEFEREVQSCRRNDLSTTWRKSDTVALRNAVDKNCALLRPFYSNAHCAVRILLFAIENTLDLKIRTGADPHSVRTLYGKSHVFSMHFSAYGEFPDSYKTALNIIPHSWRIKAVL